MQDIYEWRLKECWFISRPPKQCSCSHERSCASLIPKAYQMSNFLVLTGWSSRILLIGCSSQGNWTLGMLFSMTSRVWHEQHSFDKVVSLLYTLSEVLFASFFPIRDQDDDIHLIATMKCFILPQFYCTKTHHRLNWMRINMPTITDWPNLRPLDPCHCMSLPLEMQNTQF
jgi:hypothetical protein